ncbi:hypothetical protein TNCV_3798201 [Trichonephila clavipes]|nr:hypothetical protein TNCV_3798201 [Trichonephila clavipes]
MRSPQNVLVVHRLIVIDLMPNPVLDSINHIVIFRKASFAKIIFETPLLSIDLQSAASAADKYENLFYYVIAGFATNFDIKWK